VTNVVRWKNFFFKQPENLSRQGPSLSGRRDEYPIQNKSLLRNNTDK
jgi:hypothetical protein